MWLIPGLLFFTGAFLITISLPMWRRKVPPNGTYGFRTPLTLTNPEVWYDTNEVAGRNIAIAGVFVMLGAALNAAAMLWGYPLMPALVLITLAPLAAAIAHTFLWASLYASKRLSEPKQPTETRSEIYDEKPVQPRIRGAQARERS